MKTLNTHFSKAISLLMLTSFVVVFLSVNAYSQGVSINEGGGSPHSSAMLDVESNSKGLLIPRVEIADLNTASPVSNPAEGLLVYNENTSTGKGFYYWSGSEWLKIAVGDVASDDSKWEQDGNDIFNKNSGFVGVGTPNPGQRLNVFTYSDEESLLIQRNSSDQGATARLGFRTSATGSVNTASIAVVRANSSGRHDFQFWGHSGSAQNQIAVLQGDGNVGIGTDNPQHRLHVESAGTNTSVIHIARAGSQDRLIRLGQSGSDDGIIQINNASADERIRLLADGNSFILGNVGIGTSSPDTYFHVLGDDEIGLARFQRTTTGVQSGGIQFGNQDQMYEIFGNNERILLRREGTGNLMYWGVNGHVGVGTTSPTEQLDVNGSITLSGGSSNTVYARNFRTHTGSSLYIQDNNGDNKIRVHANGVAVTSRMVVGTGNPADAPTNGLLVNGRIRTHILNEVSDIRYKKNVEQLDKSLDKLMQIRGVQYEWRNEEFPDKHFKEGLDIGLIAQEIKKVFPEIVDADQDGYLSIQYSHLIPVLIEAIKEQQLHIESLESEITHLHAAQEIQANINQSQADLNEDLLNKVQRIKSSLNLTQNIREAKAKRIND